MRDDGQWDYTPLSDFSDESKPISKLPDYLRESILFEQNMVPVFLSKLQNHMFNVSGLGANWWFELLNLSFQYYKCIFQLID